jgi:hypothetical protein
MKILFDLFFIFLWAFVMHLAIAGEQGQESASKQKAQPQPQN